MIIEFLILEKCKRRIYENYIHTRKHKSSMFIRCYDDRKMKNIKCKKIKIAK